MEPTFVMFSIAHFGAMAALGFLILLLFLTKKKWSIQKEKIRLIERIFALSLLMMEVLYHIWLYQSGSWNWSNSLPLELCSISLMMTIVLLWTGNKHIYDFVFYAGIGGALQAVATPVLDLSFPHFRYFHFFYVHFGIILTALYFTWVKGYRPTFKGIIKTMVALNILLPCVFALNIMLQGNYMFLKEKPTNGSLLDFLGPYPWYILSLEFVAFIIFVCLWLLFRKKKHKGESKG
ncbi:TIGR02206 family membrane protein [Psychrobacillus sp.]|uniref:YwaF family protein n=1 Tax=Psychrobacillus sp. TaxID=1871623 RepID=UPI0028BE5B73|nr:TIGR02206 family membrane protein [Psychrobacillus sp.]